MPNTAFTCRPDARSKTGPKARHGPHHDAQKSTSPALAHRALTAGRRIGRLLPGNVVLRAEAGQTVIEAAGPQTMVAVTGQRSLQPVAGEAAARLRTALDALQDNGQTG